jgi:drug/metabolite transporter (DMT)-like permease
MFPIVLFLRKRIPRDGHTVGKLALLSLITVSQYIVTTSGLMEEGSGIGAVLTFTQPLFVFCLAIPFLKEKITAIKLLGAVMGFVGVVTIFIGKIYSFKLNSTIIMILGAFLWALKIIYYKKNLSNVDSFVTNFFQISVGAFLLAVLNLATNNCAFPNDVVYLWILLYSSVGAGIGTAVWLFLLTKLEATVLSSSSFIIPVIALLIGCLFLGESIYIESVLGSALILGGIYLVNSNLQKKI